MRKKHYYIILVDGECNLCNGFVDFIIRHDTQDKFKFDSLQSNNSAVLLENSEVDCSKLNSVILYNKGNLHTKSNAVLLIFLELDFPFSATIIFWIVPRFIRDWTYDIIATNRYKWFGKRDSCRLPTPEERGKFL